MKLFKRHVPEDQLQTGMSMFQSVIAVFTLLGPVLGTMCYYQFGISVSIGLVSVCFLLSAAVLSLMPADTKSDKMEHSNSMRIEMVQGLHYIRGKRILLLLGTCFCCTGLGIGFIQPLGIFLITERLGLPKEYLQWMLSLNGMGMILGGALTVMLGKVMQARSLLAVGLAVNALCMVISGLSTFMWLTLLAQFFIGMVTPVLSGSGSDFDFEKYRASLCRPSERHPVPSLYGLDADNDEHVRMAEGSVVRYGDVSVSRCVFWSWTSDCFAFVPNGTVGRGQRDEHPLGYSIRIYEFTEKGKIFSNGKETRID